MVLGGYYPYVLIFHWYTDPGSLIIHWFITPVYFQPVVNLYFWLWLYIFSDFRTAPDTAVRRETAIIIGNTVIQALPGTPGF